MKKYIFCVLLAGCAAVLPDEPTARLEFNAPDAYPEGIVYDSLARVYYVSSARLGTVGKVNEQGLYTALLTDNSLKSSYGMKIHPDGKRLFVCVGDANYSKFTSPDTRKKMARLISIDMATGKKLSDVDLSGLVPGKHFPNDLTFDSNGNAYVTDSFANVIYKVDNNGNASVFADSPLFKTEGIGINGIAWHEAGYLLTASTGTGTIYKVDMANPANVQKVKSEQFFVNADGILLLDANTLALVQNGGSDKIYRLRTEDNFGSVKMSGTTSAGDRFTYPSTATVVGDKVWVMNAKFNELTDSTSVPSARFAIQHARFLPVPK